MPRIHTDVRLDQATAEFGPYVDSYWRDFDHDPVYAAFVQAWYIASVPLWRRGQEVHTAGNLLGISNHCAAPSAEVAGFFQDVTLSMFDTPMTEVEEVA